MIKTNTNLLMIIGIIMLLGANLSAQEEIFDTRGKKFWIAFPPNFHNFRWQGGQGSIHDSISIYIAAEKPTSGTISFYTDSGLRLEERFEITDINEIHKFKRSHLEYEIIGFNNSTRLNWDSELMIPVKKSFYIESEEDIRVYANNQAVTTTDAMLVYPEKTLGTHYFVMSYYTDAGGAFSNQSTPSQFVVLATENETELTINASDALYDPDEVLSRTIKVTLQKGDSYLVQADVSPMRNTDLTGTEILSNKPIAVFAGHQRAKVRIEVDAGTSRDQLLEQMPPLQVWGSEAIIVPYIETPHSSNIGDNYDIFRILAAYDDTEIMLNGNIIDVLNKGEYFEGVLDATYYAKADKPIMVAQIKKSSTSSGGVLQIGDPFLKIIPTAELYLNNYRFINIQAWEPSSNQQSVKVYDKQYVTVITPRDNIPTITLDGLPLATSVSFEDVPGTNFAYSHIEVTDGVHYIEGRDEFGIYVYGLGNANSYGYVGGMSVNPIDHNPPMISHIAECFTIDATITDTAAIDSGIESFTINEDETENVNVAVDDFEKYDIEMSFKLSLINPYQDGSYEVKATDSIGLSRKLKGEIAGFTVALEEFQDKPSQTEFIEVDQLILDSSDYCRTFRLVNYGKFPQTVSGLDFKNADIDESLYTINIEFPVTLAPGAFLNFEFCIPFNASVSTFLSEMFLLNDCIERRVALLNIIFDKDELVPEITTQDDDPCDGRSIVIATDSLKTNYGFGDVEVLVSDNCDITIIDKSRFSIKMQVSVIDMKQDAYYEILAIDKAGNKNTFSQSIPGFYLDVSIIGAAQEMTLDLGEVPYLNNKCEIFEITNNGNSTIEILDASLRQNIEFSIPISQLPIIIQPGDTKELVVCFKPEFQETGRKFDTLALFTECFKAEMDVVGISTLNAGAMTDRCDVPINYSVGTLPEFSEIVAVYPNPVSDIAEIVVLVAEKADLSLIAYDAPGNEMMEFMQGDYMSGRQVINADFSQFAAGVYQLVLIDRTNKSIIQVVVL